MSCVCDSCTNDDETSEMHHLCEECLRDEDPNYISASALNNLVIELNTDESEVEHQITCHADSLPDVYRELCRTIEQVKKLLDPYQAKLLAGLMPTEG